MFRLVKKTLPGISFDTVNRTLLTFSKIGIVDVVEGQGSPRRFDPDVNSHHHFHCVNCGDIIDFTCHEYDNLPVPEEIRKQFSILSKKVVLNGLCRKCSGRAKGSRV